MNNLAMTLQAEGKYSDAEKLLRETLSRVTQVYGPESKNALATLVQPWLDPRTGGQAQRSGNDAAG